MDLASECKSRSRGVDDAGSHKGERSRQADLVTHRLERIALTQTLKWPFNHIQSGDDGRVPGIMAVARLRWGAVRALVALVVGVLVLTSAPMASGAPRSRAEFRASWTSRHTASLWPVDSVVRYEPVALPHSRRRPCRCCPECSCPRSFPGLPRTAGCPAPSPWRPSPGAGTKDRAGQDAGRASPDRPREYSRSSREV